MALDMSRRLFLGASAGAATAGATIGAFPLNAKPAPELLGPKHGQALLSRNENPYGPAPSAIKMIDYAAKKGAYYPDSAYPVLAGMIAERHSVDPEQVAITTGSGEALSALALMYGREGPILAPRLFWDTTALYAASLGLAEIDRVPLKDDMSIDLAAMEAKVSEETGVVQLCNPNNPTGMTYEPEAFRAAVRRMSAKAPVIVDEAYIELTGDEDKYSCVDLVREGHDVIVTRTFSKIYGMAGIRVGYAIASAENAGKLRHTAMSWIAGTGLAAAIGSYDDEAFLAFSRGKVQEARDMVMTTLDDLGLPYLPSQTNFVYFKSGKPANTVQKAMAGKNISIRGQYMDYADWSRVSMGKIEDVEKFCAALPEVVEA